MDKKAHRALNIQKAGKLGLGKLIITEFKVKRQRTLFSNSIKARRINTSSVFKGLGRIAEWDDSAIALKFSSASEVERALLFGLAKGWNSKYGNIAEIDSRIGMIAQHFDVEKIIIEYMNRIAGVQSKAKKQRELLRLSTLAFRYSNLLSIYSKGYPDVQAIIRAKQKLKDAYACQIYPCGG